MKTKAFFTGMLGLLLAFGAVLAACDNGTTGGGDGGNSNPLEGTWSYFSGGQIEGSITFSGSSYDKKEATTAGLVSFEQGTYSVSGSNITFQPTKKRDSTTGNLVEVSGTNALPSVAPYSIVGNNLILLGTTYTK
jgi:hypothetical protein